jgi:hypothetical protein
MSRIVESVATINSLIRTLLALVVVGGGALVSWTAYNSFQDKDRQREALEQTELKLADTEAALRDVRDDLDARNAELLQRLEQIAELERDVEEKAQRITQLDTSLRLLKVNHRVARLTVLDQARDEESAELFTVVEFVELSPQGEPLGAGKQFRIQGDIVFLDNWVVKFDDRYVEEAALDRSTSLVLFRRIFGEFQEPRHGFPLDDVGGRPLAYGRGGAMSELEEKIWGDFWTIANDPVLAADLGIRAAHGEALSIRLQKGRSYRILLRASDGLSIVPEIDPPQPAQPARGLSG